MEFDSPDVEKEFPGLYKSDVDNKGVMHEGSDYEEDIAGDKKSKKKEKKDKDKGYATLQADSSPDEEEVPDPKSPGKVLKIKAFTKLSSKKSKDKEKEKTKSSGVKDTISGTTSTPVSVSKKPLSLSSVVKSKEKDAKKHEKEKDANKKEKDKCKSTKDKEHKEDSKKSSVTSTSSSCSGSKSGNKIKDKFVEVVLNKSFDHHDGLKNEKSSKAHPNIPSAFILSTEPSTPSSSSVKEKEHVKSSPFNAFLNAPAPAFLSSSKKHKDKDKDHHHDVKSKVKLKLKRSKNSVEDSQQLDSHSPSSHMFPEDADSISKEIKKYEAMLEQTHTQMKSSKKVSKKHEEQLWELQRNLTQLKRKLRSVNALSSAAILSTQIHDSPPVHRKSSIVSSPPPLSTPPIFARPKSHSLPKEDSISPPQEPIKTILTRSSKVDDIPLDLRLRSPITAQESISVIDPSIIETKLSESQQYNQQTSEIKISKPSARRALDFSKIDLEPVSSDNEPQSLEKVQVQVDVHEEKDFGAKDIVPREEDPSPEEDFLEDTDEPLEDMEAVVDDANKMIGSMHEELEAAALVFQRKSHDGGIIHHNNMSTHEQAATILSKSEPTFFTDHGGDDDDDRKNEGLCLDDAEEVFNYDEENGMTGTDELDGFSLPIFQTAEYIGIENEALTLFNEQLKEELKLEEEENQRLVLKWTTECAKEKNSNEDELETEDLIEIWRDLKLKNSALHDHVSTLQKLVAQSRLEEFLLETRLRYLENHIAPVSPRTVVTPLQNEIDTDP